MINLDLFYISFLWFDTTQVYLQYTELHKCTDTDS